MSAELRTRRYRRWRRAYLARHPLCVRCLARGRTQAATDIDHIVQRAAGGALMRDTNVRPLCRDCHRDRGRGRWTPAEEALRGGDTPTAADLEAQRAADAPRSDADARARHRAREARAAAADLEAQRRGWQRHADELR